MKHNSSLDINSSEYSHPDISDVDRSLLGQPLSSARSDSNAKMGSTVVSLISLSRAIIWTDGCGVNLSQ